MDTQNNTTEKKMDYTKFLGTWLNAYDNSDAIAKMIIKPDGDRKMQVQIFGVEGGRIPGDWGVTTAIPLSLRPGGTEAAAFKAQFKNDAFEATLAVNDNKGLLVIAAFIYFTDGSNREDVFAREFYFRE